MRGLDPERQKASLRFARNWPSRHKRSGARVPPKGVPSEKAVVSLKVCVQNAPTGSARCRFSRVIRANDGREKPLRYPQILAVRALRLAHSHEESQESARHRRRSAQQETLMTPSAV
eukprot:scaffold7595_cov267-Pinguiococcus_pyrenoidosus.AAC.5